MYTKILGTFSSKVYSSAIGFAVVILTSRYLGAEGRGEISLFIANLTLVQLFNEIIIGPAMIFLVPRHKVIHLFFISILWSFVSTFSVVLILYFLGLSQQYLSTDLFYLSLAYAIFSAAMMILQGKQNIKRYNLINILQSSILIVSLCVFLFVLNQVVVESFIYTLYFAYLIPMFLSTFYVLRLCDDFNLKNITQQFVVIFKTGFTAQISNFLNFANARISYYIIALMYLDKASLGIFALATSLVESVWLVSYSLASIQYPIIASSKDSKKVTEISLSFSKITFWVSTILLTVILVIPESFYLLIFGNEFNGVKEIILLLSPGILSLSVSKIYWNYFGGLGKFNINNTAGLIGFSISICSCYILTHYFGINGTACATAITYIASSCYLLIIFKIHTGLEFKQLLPGINDYKLLRKI